jgi:hypothetical protein
MTTPRKAQEVLDREFLEIRAKLLQLAAHFDRIERAEGDADLNRIAPIRQALEILSSAEVGPHRAEKLQQIFSRAYDPDWRKQMKVDEARAAR